MSRKTKIENVSTPTETAPVVESPVAPSNVLPIVPVESAPVVETDLEKRYRRAKAHAQILRETRQRVAVLAEKGKTREQLSRKGFVHREVIVKRADFANDERGKRQFEACQKGMAAELLDMTPDSSLFAELREAEKAKREANAQAAKVA